MTVHPPKPRFVFSVGVIGHRPDRLPAEMLPRIEQDIADILTAIRTETLAVYKRYADCFARSAPRLVVITALAEGSDCIAAKLALELGFELEAPLPFAAQEYERDFTEAEAKHTFRGFLESARVVLELEGDRAHAGKSYAAAGLIVLDMADMISGVWDGGEARGRGGTAELIGEAARRGMPVVGVGATTTDAPRLYWRGLDDRHTTPIHLDDHPTAPIGSSLAGAIEALVRPPPGGNEKHGLGHYFREKERRIAPRFEFPLLMLLLGLAWPRKRDFLLPHPEALAKKLIKPGGGSHAIAAAFGWADSLATRFAQDFRSAVVSNFLLSAIAVFVAVALPYPWSAIELGLILVLVVNAIIGNWRGWHHRWIESRELAERLRVASAMYMLASRISAPFGVAPTWPAWYARAIRREAGLRNGRLGETELSEIRLGLLKLVTDQAAYHERTSQSFTRLHARLNNVGLFSFVAALVATAAILLVRGFGLFPYTEGLARFAIVVSATLPAIASASYAIRIIGDFEGAAKRSRRMKTQLDALALSLEDRGSELEWLHDRVHKAGEILLSDLANWRLAAESRGLAMPG